jgi:hypothetical protein
MLVMTARVVALYVDKADQRCVVRDAEGKYWSLPSTENPWGERQPITQVQETALEPVPGNYKYMLGLPI